MGAAEQGPCPAVVVVVVVVSSCSFPRGAVQGMQIAHPKAQEMARSTPGTQTCTHITT